MNKSVLLLFLFFQVPMIYAGFREIGTPRVINYDVSLISAGSQTWMIDESPSGLVFFANNDGVLVFDGKQWQVYALPGGVVVRSVLAYSDSIIYAAGFNEFGYFCKDYEKGYVYHSLVHLLPADKKDFGEVWKIHALHHGVLFQSYEQIMIFKPDSFTDEEKSMSAEVNQSKANEPNNRSGLPKEIQVISAPSSFHFSFQLHGDLFIVDVGLGLHRLLGDQLVLLPGASSLQGEEIWAVLPYGNELLLATDNDGIYIFNGARLKEWKNSAADMLRQCQVYSACPLSNHRYAFGTVQNGLLICDTSGIILQLINFDKGLQNNTVLSVFPDQFNNLWLGLDGGIDYVEINSPLRYLSYPHQVSAGYTSILKDGILYLGTNRGVFYQVWNDLSTLGGQDFRLIPGTEGQVWSLQEIDKTILCGHNSGVFQISGTDIRKVTGSQGAWMFLKPTKNSAIILAGTYNGLVRFEKQNGNWLAGTRISGFRESSRFIVPASDSSLWISHGYKGVFRVHFNNDYSEISSVEHFGKAQGLPSDFTIQVCQIKDRAVFTTPEGLFTFNENSKKFFYNDSLNRLFDVKQLRALKEDSGGNVWYFTDSQPGVFRLQEDGNYVNVSMPFRELKDQFIKGFEHVQPIDESDVLIGVQKGFVHYNTNVVKSYQQAYNSFITELFLPSCDSVLLKGAETFFVARHPIAYQHNRLQFKFSANYNENPNETLFSTYLEGFDESWSAYQKTSFREFTNLPSGPYTFYVKAKNIYDYESKTASLQFELSPPWYLSWYAYLLYTFMLFLVLFLIRIYLIRRIAIANQQEEERQKQVYEAKEKQLKSEAIEAEKEVIRLRNENLRAAMRQKDKELANSTMQMIQKSKTLTLIKKDIEKLSKDIRDDLLKAQFGGLIRKIDREINSDQQWEVFEKHFENVYEEFLKRLKNSYPDLSPREMKLCAYLRLNISSKEIAALMNISTRGVEISRYRLRKKLSLDHQVNLTDFIMSF